MLTLLVLRLALAAVFCIAAVGKLLDPQGTRALAEHHRLPRPLAKAAGALPAVDLAIAAALVIAPSARAAGAACAVLLTVFSVFVVRDLRGGGSDGCGCFGRFGSTTARTALLRNGLLTGAALVVAASPTAPRTVVGLALVGTAVALVVLARVRARAARTRPGQRLLLFLDPDCGHCRALLPALRAWSGPAQVQVVARAGASVDDEFARSLPSAAPLVIDGGELARRHGVAGTPAAVLLDVDGRLRRTVSGAAGVQALLAGRLDDDRHRLEGLTRGRRTLDRRGVLALGAGSAVALALPGTSLGGELSAALSKQTGVKCPSCGDCTICDAVGSPPKLTCRPCKQKCSARDLCVNYANKLPAYLQLASYLQSQGFTQSKDPVAQGLQQNGKLTVFGTSTEFTNSSSQTPKAVLFYSLTNSGGSASVAFMKGKGLVVAVAVVGAGGKVATAAIPPVTPTKRKPATLGATRAAGYGCAKTCEYAATLSLALLETGITAVAAPEEVGFEFAKALFEASFSLVKPSGPAPSPQDAAMNDLVSAITAASMLDHIIDGMKEEAISAFCNEVVCSWTLQACCSYGGCYDSLTACAKSCPESLKYQAPCLVYLNGHGLHTYLGRF